MTSAAGADPALPLEQVLVLELKAVESFAAIHSHLELGLLINFKVPVLKQGLERVVSTLDPWRALRLGGPK